MKKILCQSRNWCFTDFELLEWETIYNENKDIIRYICWGEEVCPKTKKKHIQGWIQFRNKKRMGGIKRMCRSKKLHLESCYGSEYSNDKYCKKAGEFTTKGKFKSQGQRSDLEQISRELMDGSTLNDVALNHPEKWIQYGNGFKSLKKEIDQSTSKKFRKIHTYIYTGKTGTGKTRLATEEHKNAFLINGFALDWWDGYNGEETLIIDEYANDVKITVLLKLLDGYQMRLPVKGSFTYAKWKRVIITTNLSWDDIHPNAKQAHKDALERRIHKVCTFLEDGRIEVERFY